MSNVTQPSTGSRRQLPIRLIATDIDGTLLDSENSLPQQNRAALEAAVAAGVRLALVTARKQSSTFAVAELLGLPCACIAHNGARIWDWTGRELQHLVVDLPLARDVVRFAQSRAIPLVVTVDEVNFYSTHYPWRVPQGVSQERRVADIEEALSAPPTRIIVTGGPGVEAVCAAFGNAPDSVVMHRYYSREGAMASAVITHPRAHKAAAVAMLAKHNSIEPAEVLALGDAEADAGMLAWAGVGVAMGNAMPQARAAARWIAPSHDEAGFAVAVQKFVLDQPAVDQALPGITQGVSAAAAHENTDRQR